MTGAGILTRFILRRDKFFIPLWLLGLAALVLSVAPALDSMFTTDTERLIIAETMQNPAMIAMCGPFFDFSEYHTGAMYAQMMMVWTVALWAVMNIFLAIRHTRKDEEEGRLELIKALPVDRQAGLVSTISAIIITNLLSFLIVGFGLAFMNIDNMSFNGSLLFGACVGATGLVFGGIALVFSQICSGSRGAVGLSLAVLGIFYMMRAVGDIGTEALSFISPLGLVTRTEVFITDIVWPVLVLIAQAIILFIITMLINSKRDIEQGLLSARKGRSHASFLLGSTPGLIIKLLKSTIVAWAVTIYLLGAAYGSIFGDIESFINSSDIIRQMFTVDSTSDMNLQFVNTLMVVMTIIATVAVLMTILRLRSEEKKGQLDDILARHVSREKLMACYIGIALIFSIVLQFLTALGLWQAASMVMDDPMEFSEILKTAFIYVPAMFIFIGIASALIGVFPKGTIVVWLFLGYAFFIDYFGEILDLPDWTNNITPFGQTPRFPVESFEAAPVAIMCGISIILIVFGFIGFRRRDIQ